VLETEVCIGLGFYRSRRGRGDKKLLLTCRNDRPLTARWRISDTTRERRSTRSAQNDDQPDRRRI